jgi:hypothetical protein
MPARHIYIPYKAGSSIQPNHEVNDITLHMSAIDWTRQVTIARLRPEPYISHSIGCSRRLAFFTNVAQGQTEQQTRARPEQLHRVRFPFAPSKCGYPTIPSHRMPTSGPNVTAYTMTQAPGIWFFSLIVTCIANRLAYTPCLRLQNITPVGAASLPLARSRPRTA